MIDFLEKAKKFSNNYKTKYFLESNKLFDIVIPSFHSQHLDYVIDRLDCLRKLNKIIIVNDFDDKFKINRSKKRKHDIILAHHNSNFGAGSARNTGFVLTKSEYVLFLDSDMIISDSFIDNSFRLMEANKDNCLIIGLRRNEDINTILTNKLSKNEIDDWRVNTHYDDSFLDLRICSKINHAVNKDKHDFSLLKETNFFKKLGVSLENTIDVWDLASVVVGHSILVSKTKYLEVGGFPEFTKGWGCEDMAFGLLCISNRMFIIPNQKVITHIQHVPISGSISNNLTQLKENLERYKAWGRKLINFNKLDYKIIKKRIIKTEVIYGSNI